MTNHYFENDFIKLHYYKFGNGPKHMLCFHGFGMHGKQFKVLEEKFGDIYTFWGFDLLFHKETVLKDNSIATIKKGISKKQLVELFKVFCKHQNIDAFSVIGYSMGSHYATVLVEEMPERIKEYIVAAPSSLEPGGVIRFFSDNRIGNKMIEKLLLSKKATLNLLRFFKSLRLIDSVSRDILFKEVNTPELRFAIYGCLTYLRPLETDESKLINALNTHHIKSFFFFGGRDKNYLPAIGNAFFKKYTPTKIVTLDENHEMINQNFASTLADLLL
jgi:pimeloyl-ACP methyl ester carboxylesterase